MGKLLDNLRKKHAAAQPKAGRHTVNFLAHRDDIAEAMREGWTAKKIWEQMREDGMTAMSYSTFCRHVDRHIMPSIYDAHGAVPAVDAAKSSASSPKKSRMVKPTKEAKAPKKMQTEKERLDLLKEEAFTSVRSAKPTGPLITKPKSPDEENEELFG